MKILVVCLGNICRSPLAEGILKQKSEDLNLGLEIDSAGTNGYHTGEAPHHLSQKVARLHGIDIGNQIARRFKKSDMEEFDQIYAMASDVMEEMKQIAGNAFRPEKVKLFLDELYPGEHMDVPDPWYGSEDGYHEVYDLINRASDAIVYKYSQELSKLY